MYNLFKKVFTMIVPKDWIQNHQSTFRKLLYIFYWGNKYQCNICLKKLRSFIQTKDENTLCPYCASLSRTRRLWDIIEKFYLKENLTVLDFSPSKSIYQKWKSLNGLNYYSSDYENEFVADYKFDIRNITMPDQFFDLIVCYHVLEHIEDDQSAIQELYRVLKNRGTCIIQCPFKEGDIFEDFSIRTEADRLTHYGQKDHVRIYTAQALKQRMQKAGFNVEIKTFSNEDPNIHSFKRNEQVLICSKLIEVVPPGLEPGTL